MIYEYGRVVIHATFLKRKENTWFLI